MTEEEKIKLRIIREKMDGDGITPPDFLWEKIEAQTVGATSSRKYPFWWLWFLLPLFLGIGIWWATAEGNKQPTVESLYVSKVDSEGNETASERQDYASNKEEKSSFNETILTVSSDSPSVENDLPVKERDHMTKKSSTKVTSSVLNNQRKQQENGQHQMNPIDHRASSRANLYSRLDEENSERGQEAVISTPASVVERNEEFDGGSSSIPTALNEESSAVEISGDTLSFNPALIMRDYSLTYFPFGQLSTVALVSPNLIKRHYTGFYIAAGRNQRVFSNSNPILPNSTEQKVGLRNPEIGFSYRFALNSRFSIRSGVGLGFYRKLTAFRRVTIPVTSENSENRVATADGVMRFQYDPSGEIQNQDSVTVLMRVRHRSSYINIPLQVRFQFSPNHARVAFYGIAGTQMQIKSLERNRIIIWAAKGEREVNLSRSIPGNRLQFSGNGGLGLSFPCGRSLMSTELVYGQTFTPIYRYNGVEIKSSSIQLRVFFEF